ncbi:MAG: sulfur carrier protein ThiS [Ehrlichia sp.]
MITLIINGKAMSFEAELALNEILCMCGYNTDLPFAVAVNKNLVLRSQYSSTYLNNGDVIDVVYPMQGG